MNSHAGVNVMSKLGTVTFVGKSGHRYQFSVYPLDVNLKKGVGGVYFITARKDEPNAHHTHHKVFLGETCDLSEVSGGHPKQTEFAAEGANCVCIHATRDKGARARILQDLLERYSPACNQ